MNKKTEIRICPYCQKEFEVKTTSRQKFCSGTCKTYMSQVRTGKKESFGQVAIGGVASQEISILEKLEKIAKENYGKMMELYAVDMKIAASIKELIAERENIKIDQGNLPDAIRTLENDLKNMESWGEDNLEENELIELREDKVRIKKELEVAKIRVEKEYKRGLEIDVLIPKIQVARFRNIEKTRILFKAQFTDEKVLTISEFKALSKFNVKYPFEELMEGDFIEDYKIYLRSLDNLPQPFLANIFGEKGSGKTSVMLTLVKELTTLFEASVLYVMDFHILINDFWEMVDKKNINDKMDFLRLENRLQITQYLEKKEYEFLVLDLPKSYNFTYKFFYDLQKQYPRLSIFCISLNPMTGLNNMAHLILEVRNGVGKPLKGGDALNPIIGWEDADGSDFYPTEKKEHNHHHTHTNYEEVGTIQNNQYSLPPRNFMDDFLMFSKMMGELQSNPQNTIVDEAAIQESISKDLQIKLLEEKIAKKKGL